MRRLLWVDEDGPGRFLFEEAVISDQGWQVVWAGSVEDAAEKLRQESFNAAVLDQNLANKDAGTPRAWLIWGACRLLYWLRNKRTQERLPWLPEGQRDPLRATPPLKKNRKVFVVIVSAFHDEEVLRMARQASPGDRDLKLLAKPVELDELLRELRSASA